MKTESDTWIECFRWPRCEERLLPRVPSSACQVFLQSRQSSGFGVSELKGFIEAEGSMQLCRARSGTFGGLDAAACEHFKHTNLMLGLFGFHIENHSADVDELTWEKSSGMQPHC